MAWSLPPDCTLRDIDRWAGDYLEECAKCCDEVMANELEEGLCKDCLREEQLEREEEDDERTS
jgi:reverse gyrase